MARDMISHARKSGCNAVKFQAFQENTVSNHPQVSRLIKSSISESNIHQINKLAKSIGIEWFCTPMYPEAVDMLDPFVKRFKIRVSDAKPILDNKKSEILERILKTEKEIIISSEVSPIDSNYYSHPKIKWLYCVPKYPCELTDLDFRNIRYFSGYSNHCPIIIAPLTAAILGSNIIEIHITSDKSKDFFDNNVSFDYHELTDLVKAIRLSEKIRK
ncbi:MAG TPA: N-acetylneuraminate synthase family protein [Candidatus Nitrosotalea sp.]|nr:N-acetylneuraminate synthase family protein [Candidatus Nitrosotalea sp.]